jgi:N-methylhydantoinase A
MDPETGRTDDALREQREIYLSERLGFVRCPVYDRALLRHGAELAGPAVIEQMDTTTVLLPGDRCRVDTHRNLIIDVGGTDE